MEEERKIPVFTVLKNGAILKNIFIIDRPESVSKNDGDSGLEMGETLTVGRHPDCSIMLTHPSISRFHLQILTKSYSQKLFVTDLSSVHGTWVSDRKIEPGVRVELKEGDVLRIGGSTRTYRLHWIPFSQAYDVDNSFISQTSMSGIPEKQDEGARVEAENSAETHQITQLEKIISNEDEEFPSFDVPQVMDSLFPRDSSDLISNKAISSETLAEVCDSFWPAKEDEIQSSNFLEIQNMSSTFADSAADTLVEVKLQQCDQINYSSTVPLTVELLSAHNKSTWAQQFGALSESFSNSIREPPALDAEISSLPKAEAPVKEPLFASYPLFEDQIEEKSVADEILDSGPETECSEENREARNLIRSDSSEYCQNDDFIFMPLAAKSVSLSSEEPAALIAVVENQEKQALQSPAGALSEMVYFRKSPLNSEKQMRSFELAPLAAESAIASSDDPGAPSGVTEDKEKLLDAVVENKEKQALQSPAGALSEMVRFRMSPLKSEKQMRRFESAPLSAESAISSSEDPGAPSGVTEDEENQTLQSSSAASVGTSISRNSPQKLEKQKGSFIFAPPAANSVSTSVDHPGSRFGVMGNKESLTHQSDAALLSELTNFKNHPSKSKTRSSIRNILSRRGKSAGLHIQTSGSKGKNNGDELQRKEILNDDVENEIFTPDKENLTPNTLVSKRLQEICKPEESRSSSFKNGKCKNGGVRDDRESESQREEVLIDKVESNIYTPEKENFTPKKTEVKSFCCKSNGKVTRACQLDIFKADMEDLTLKKLEDVKSPFGSKGESGGTCENSEAEMQKHEGPSNEAESEIFTPEKENLTPDSHLLEWLKEAKEFDEIRSPYSKTTQRPLLSATFSSPNIRPEENGLQVKGSGSKGKDSGAEVQKEEVSIKEEERGIFTPDKENITPTPLGSKRLLKISKLQETKSFPSSLAPVRSNCKTGGACVDNNEDKSQKEEGSTDKPEPDIFTPDKENLTPITHALQRLCSIDLHAEGTSFSSKSKGRSTRKTKGVCENSETELLQGHLRPNNLAEPEIFIPHKENLTPDDHMLRRLQEVEEFEEISSILKKLPKPLSSAAFSSPSTRSGVNVLNVSVTEKPKTRMLKERTSASQNSRSHVNIESTLKRKTERIPFHPLPVSSSVKGIPTGAPTTLTSSSNSLHCLQTIGKRTIHTSHGASFGESERRWTVVVDTSSLLDKESRKSLQLLEGVKGTQLVIPRTVIRELDGLRRQHRFFRRTRTREVSSILGWIEKCMINTKWWIHVQSSAEELGPTAPTPPVSPQLGCSGGGTSLFSVNRDLPEIVSPSAEDHVLDCALVYRKLSSDGQLVLLSKDVTLKIKSMAEGLLCETATEFYESLANPFSERFMWRKSSPRGQTWSHLDDVILRERYSRCPFKKSESAKGLKLILLHNSHYRQVTSS